MKKWLAKSYSFFKKYALLWSLLVCAIFFVVIALKILKKEPIVMDVIFYNLIAKFISTPLTVLAKFITEFGDIYVLVTITILILFFSHYKKVKLLVPVNLNFVVLLNQILKYILQRPRPEIFRLTVASGFSFPSGHSMTSVAFYGYLLYLLHKYSKNNKQKYIFSIGVLFLIVLVGLSRIYLGVHYLSDVLAGYLIAFIYLVFFIKLSEKYYIEGGYMKNGTLLDSFKYAFIGIFTALKEERNLFIHAIFMILVIFAGIGLQINIYEWFICIILFLVVISAELFNTAIEATVNLACQEIHPLAKKAKDISAGAVLITAIGAAIIGLIIFVPKLLNLFF